MDRALRGETRIDAATKTGAEWVITTSPSLAALLARQRKRRFLAGPGWVFSTEVGTASLCSNRQRHGWDKVPQRAKVEPRERAAQKALPRSYITSAVVCGQNPKPAATELNHATPRTVVSQHDSFLDPAHGPDDQERAALISIYEWTDVEITARHPGDGDGTNWRKR